MFRKFYLLLIIIISFIGCSSLHFSKNTPEKTNYSYVNYYKFSAIADSLHFIKEYEKSFVTMDTIFKKAKPLNIRKLREYDTYLRNKYILGKKINLKEVEIVIKDHGKSLKFINSDSIFKLIYKEKNITQKMYDELHSEYKNSIDLELRQKLIKALEEDQEARFPLNKEKMLKIDLKNEKMLVDLFEKGIYPNSSVIGHNFHLDENYYLLFEVLLYHTNKSIRVNYFLPKIKKFIKEGKCHDPTIYMVMVDHMLPKNKYGVYNLDSIEKKDFAKINYNRSKLDFGTTSIQYDLWWIMRQYK